MSVTLLTHGRDANGEKFLDAEVGAPVLSCIQCGSVVVSVIFGEGVSVECDECETSATGCTEAEAVAGWNRLNAKERP